MTEKFAPQIIAHPLMKESLSGYEDLVTELEDAKLKCLSGKSRSFFRAMAETLEDDNRSDQEKSLAVIDLLQKALRNSSAMKTIIFNGYVPDTSGFSGFQAGEKEWETLDDKVYQGDISKINQLVGILMEKHRIYDY